MADLFVTVPQEKYRVFDFIYGVTRSVQSQNALSAGLRENPLHLSETPSNLSLTVNLSVNVSETIRLRDWIYGANRDATANARSSGQVELPKVGDGGQVELRGLGNALKISEQLSVWMTDIYQLEPIRIGDFIYGASIGPPATVLSIGLREQAVEIAESMAQVFPIRLPDEGVKISAGPGIVEILDSFDPVLHIQDTVQASLQVGSDLSVTLAQESLKLADSTLTLRLDPEQTSSASESLKLQDAATIVEDPEQTSGFDESLKIQDSVTVSLTLLFASGFDETLHVQDSLAASMGGLSVAVTSESLKISDSVTIVEDPEQISLTESLKVQDTVSVVETPEQTSGFDESLRIQDTVSVSLTLLLASGFDDSLKLQDTVTATMSSAGLINGSPGDEPLHVQDQVTVSITPISAVVISDALKLADVVTAAVQLAVSPTAETAKLSDAITVAIGLDAGAVGETLRLQDVVVESRVSPLLVTVTDLLFIGETLTLGTGAPISAAFVSNFIIVLAPGHIVIVPPTGRLVAV